MVKEIWKPVVGFEGLYVVSSAGRVKSIERDVPHSFNKVQHIPERILTPINNSAGYYYVSLCKEGVIRRILVHRIVAEAFIPNPFGLPFINHKDENPANNAVDNLEWCNNSYNQKYGSANNKRMVARIEKDTSTAPKPVMQLSEKGALIKIFASASEAARDTGLDRSLISRRCRTCNRHLLGGYIWRFLY